MTDLKELFKAFQDKMLNDANCSRAINHTVDKGNIAEETWIKWFNSYLPKRYSASKATVIDCHSNTSDQIDIVLYDTQYSHMVFEHCNIKYIPAESVYAIFEIKPTLNKKNLEYAGDKAKSVRKLYRTSTDIHHAGGCYKPKELFHIISGILTTDSDWSMPFDSNVIKNLNRFNLEQQIDFGCVLNAGSFYYNYEEKSIQISEPSESLVFFFLQLLCSLQKMGTVPAIDLKQYMRNLNIRSNNNV